MKKLLVLMVFVPGLAFAQASNEQMCKTTGALVGQALDLRASGQSQDQAVATIQNTVADSSSTYHQAAPTLVQIAYDFNLDLMTKEEAVNWYIQTCLGG